MEPTVTGWRGIAYNQAKGSENRIHSDEVARRYGFRGGLVPGITVYAYLVQPAVVAWGVDWLARGSSDVALRKPLYDGGAFRVETKPDGAAAYSGEVIDADDVVCAVGRVALPQAPAPAAPRRGDAPAPAREARPEATGATLETLRERGMGAVHMAWPWRREDERYLRDLDAMPALVRPGAGGFANPAFTLGLANRALDGNVRLGPWIHAQSEARHHAPIPWESRLVVESSVADLFERSGHAFVDLEVTAFLEPDTPVLSARHRAIYRLRET